jgi:hypothetical protein
LDDKIHLALQWPRAKMARPGEGRIESEVLMLKAAIIACLACAGGAFVLASSSTGVNEHPMATTGSRSSLQTTRASFQELHANAHLENLPALDQRK